MKPKIQYAVVTVMMFLICIVAALLPTDKTAKRIHQHLENQTESAIYAEDKTGSHLPIISIETGGQRIPGEPVLDNVGNAISFLPGVNGEEMVKVNISIMDKEAEYNDTTDDAVFATDALIRLRGNSSRNFDKKSYLIRFVDKTGDEADYAVMGMYQHDEWALYGPFLDKTLIRNYMWMNISAEIMGYAPNVRFCECYIDGEFKGLYLMMETIGRSEGRVDINEYEPGDAESSYIVKLDKLSNDEKSLENFTYYTLNTEYNTELSIIYPAKRDLSDDLVNYVESDISQFEKVLYSYDFKDPEKGYRAYINVDSFVDYYVLQEFLSNNDMCSRSTYLYKDVRGKLAMGPVWDYNNVCNNYINLEFDGSGMNFIDRTWYTMLLKDEYFVEKVIERYKQLRKSYLSEDYLLNYIDETTAYLGDEIDRNYSVWGYSFQREHQLPGISRRPIELNPTSYDEAIDQLRYYIVKRGDWMDRNIETLYQYCHESKIKQFVD
ncbi:MAG: CotH kinase family protein [Acetobacterium sp.]|uniref:CotH kinase family protein n=1 Tax=Acetobacterium sp. TaxID=1872094 RepID=UPI003242D854